MAVVPWYVEYERASGQYPIGGPRLPVITDPLGRGRTTGRMRSGPYSKPTSTCCASVVFWAYTLNVAVSPCFAWPTTLQ